MKVTWTDTALQRLSTYPEVGRFAPELIDRAVRELIYGRYRVFYKVESEAARVIILSVQHGSQLVGEQEVSE